MLKSPLSGHERASTANRKPRVTMARQVAPADTFSPPAYQQTRAYAGYDEVSNAYYAEDTYQKPATSPARRGNSVYRPLSNGRAKKKKHPFISALVALVSLALIGAASYFMLPMVLDAEHSPYMFANGYILKRSDYKIAEFEHYQQYLVPYLQNDQILPGVYVDNYHVGSMTPAQARELLEQNDSGASKNFSVTVNIGNKSWPFDSSLIPFDRNINSVLEKAYAYGRQTAYGTGKTPYQQQLDAALSLRNGENEIVNLHTEVTYDKSVVRELISAIVNYVDRPVRDAQISGFDFVRKSFSFLDESAGVMVDGDELYNDVVAKLDTREPNAVLIFEPNIIEPQVSKLQLMNEYKLISTYTTQTTSNSNRNTNVRLSAQAINGHEVKPGEVFSFNQTTGQRTEEKGYKEAIAISGGQNVPDIGGGVCQTSGTLFNAVARADLEIVYRSPHAWPSTYVEKGMDATVNWPNLDFKFKNNKDTPIYIVAYYSDRLITVEIYGKTLGSGITIDLESEVIKTIKPPSEIRYVNNTNLPIGTSKDTIQARTGYQVDTYKIWYQDGQEIKRDLFVQSTYKMYQRTVEYN